MLEIAIASAIAAVIAGVVTAAMVPFAAKIAFAVRAVDYPGGRKFHGGPCRDSAAWPSLPEQRSVRARWRL